jgi:dTDP-D-glucose 4,6-dehydratase
MIANALNDKPLPVYGDGGNVRDWIHVLDHCAAVDRVLHAGVPGEVYNIGGSSERKNLEVVKVILRTLRKPESLIYFVKDRPGHQSTIAGMRSIQRRLSETSAGALNIRSKQAFLRRSRGTKKTSLGGRELSRENIRNTTRGCMRVGK